MNIGLRRGSNRQVERHLLFFSVLLAVACLAYIPYTPQPIVPDIPSVAIPLAVSLGLVVFTFQVRPGRYERGQAEQIVGYAWFGLLASAGISGWWLAIHRHTDLPVGGVVDEVLTIVSVGIGAGVVVGNLRHTQHDTARGRGTAMRIREDDQRPNRERVLAETSWIGRQGDTPVFEALVETLADLEGLDLIELESLYDHVNPEAFTELQAQEDSQWQLTFYTNRYEVRVSSMGTVTVYDIERPTNRP